MTAERKLLIIQRALATKLGDPDLQKPLNEVYKREYQAVFDEVTAAIKRGER